ncbi:MAG: 2Fe-2S iron-sulfur cluster binding domain-containing protein [Treponema sp.]|jgi:carbon-monoxide dehydrogenase small subunit|nr:2Fe-2S iron-sulfur cluster binding domain-containing protein [Treponema sp.]
MTIGFILNGEDVVVRTEAGVRLIDILRGNFGLLGSKTSCLEGQCGACTVIFNGQVSPACLLPAFKIRGSEIITIEGFSQTIEYHEIMDGFRLANLGNCGYCMPGKILCTSALLDRTLSPSKKEILIGFSGIKCRCTNVENLLEAVNIISGIRHKRLYGRSS